jgi:hypothetical protein
MFLAAVGAGVLARRPRHVLRRADRARGRVRHRRRRAAARGERRYSTQLVNAAGLALVVFGLFAGLVGVFSFEGENPFALGRGWEAVLVVASLLVIAYGLFARERGPAWMGAVSFSFALAGGGRRGGRDADARRLAAVPARRRALGDPRVAPHARRRPLTPSGAQARRYRLAPCPI